MCVYIIDFSKWSFYISGCLRKNPKWTIVEKAIFEFTRVWLLYWLIALALYIGSSAISVYTRRTVTNYMNSLDYHHHSINISHNYNPSTTVEKARLLLAVPLLPVRTSAVDLVFYDARDHRKCVKSFWKNFSLWLRVENFLSPLITTPFSSFPCSIELKSCHWVLYTLHSK